MHRASWSRHFLYLGRLLGALSVILGLPHAELGAQAEAAVAPDGNDGYRTYADPQGRFRLSYPATWKILPSSQVAFAIKNCPFCEQQETFTVAIDNAGELAGKASVSAARPASEIEATLRPMFPDATVIRAGTMRVAGSEVPYTLTKYSIQKVGQRFPRTLLQIFIIEGNRLCVLSWSTHPEHHAEVRPVLDGILHSLTFK